MLASSSLLHLPFQPDLTQAGIEYALRSLAFTYDRMGGSEAVRLRRIVAGKGVELGLRRYLDAQGVPYDTLGMTPFTDPDHYDLALGGHPCDLKSFLICQRQRIRRIRQQPAELLQAEALVPADQLTASHLGGNGLYLFAFATALVTRHTAELEKVIVRRQPVYLMCPLPVEWARPGEWKPLERLALKSEYDDLQVEVGGQSATREFQTETIDLAAAKPARLRTPFYSLAYVHLSTLPRGRLALHEGRSDRTYVIEPYQWSNIWVYGMDIFLVGYLTQAEFQRRAVLIAAGSSVWQYATTRTANYAVKVGDLHPLPELLARVKRWGSKKAAPIS